MLEKLIRERMDIDDTQSGLVSGRSTTDAIFIVKKLHYRGSLV